MAARIDFCADRATAPAIGAGTPQPVQYCSTTVVPRTSTVTLNGEQVPVAWLLASDGANGLVSTVNWMPPTPGTPAKPMKWTSVGGVRPVNTSAMPYVRDFQNAVRPRESARAGRKSGMYSMPLGRPSAS